MPLFGFMDASRPSFAPAATARAPTKYEIKDFVGDQQGVDDMTTSTLTMLHNNDTVTLINPFEGVTAFFTVKTVTARSELELTGWKAQPAKTDVADFTLVTGETKAFTLAEGTDYTPETGFLPEKINRDIYITLTHVETPSGETQYTGAGQAIFGPGGYWSPQNVIKRVRGRRMVVGGESQSAFLTPSERKNIIEMTKEGEVYSPRQLAMVRAAYAIEGVRGRVGVMSLARPSAGGSGRAGGGYGGPEGASERASVGIKSRFRPY